MDQKPLEDMQIHESILPKEETPEEIMRLVERLAPKIEHERKTVRVMMLDNGQVPPIVFERLRHLCSERGVDLVLPPAVVDPIPERGTVLLDAGARLSELVVKLIREMKFEPEPCTEKCIEPPVTLPPPKKQMHSFKQFQNTRQNHGPSIRRQFAQIRPPRRGGR